MATRPADENQAGLENQEWNSGLPIRHVHHSDFQARHLVKLYIANSPHNGCIVRTESHASAPATGGYNQ